MSNKIFKFGFIADIKSVSLALKSACVVSVYWKRGQKTAEIQHRKEIEHGVAAFNEKLEIQCNMSFNIQTEVFEEKKTKFTVVIFSEKGTKQAGEVYVDVAQLLNAKSKKLTLEKSLEKCPDKNAKLVFELTGYMKEEISPDSISQASMKSVKVQPSETPTMQLDFKKKKKQPAVAESKQVQRGGEAKEADKREKNVLPVTKQNLPKVQLSALSEQNKKLRAELKNLKQLQVENENLKRQEEAGEKKAIQHYSKKYEELKLEYKETKEKLQKMKGLKENKKNLEKQLCDNKDQMAAILNYAVLNRMNDLAEELTNIYSCQQID